MTTYQTQAYRVRQLFSTLAAVTASNPVLLEGEKWNEKDAATGRATGRTKTGDGVVSGTAPNQTITGTAFNDLPFDPGGSGGGATNLSITNRTAAGLTIASDTGGDAEVPVASASLAGLESAADKAKLDSITVNSALEIRIYVRNNSGVSIPKGSPCYQTGSSGTTITVALADASSEATASQTIGLAESVIANNSFGYLKAAGELSGVNTSLLAEGQIVWLSETTGALTTTRPTQPAHGVVCGYCVKQGSGTSGILYVKIDNGLELSELHDVLITSATAGQGLRLGSDGLWRNYLFTAADVGADAAGTAATAVAAHAAAADPHPTYATAAEAAAAAPVQSVAITPPSGWSASSTNASGSVTLALALPAGFSLPSDASQANWSTAYSERLRWDGGATGLNAATGRASLELGTAALAAASDFATPSALASGLAGKTDTATTAALATRLDGFRDAQAFYVSKRGTASDSNNGTSHGEPFLTIGAAVSAANAYIAANPTSLARIEVGPGTFTEGGLPFRLKPNIYAKGAAQRGTIIKPASGQELNGFFAVDSGDMLECFRFAGHQATGTSSSDSSVGTRAWAVRFNEQANSGQGPIIYASPYIKDCASITAEDDEGLAGSTSTGDTGGGVEVDGAKVHPDSPIRSMVVYGFTQQNLGGPGVIVKNDAYAELVSFFGIFCTWHVQAETGGWITLSGGGCSEFGTYGVVADGYSSTALYTGSLRVAASSGATSVDVVSLTTNRLGSSRRPHNGQIMLVGGTGYVVVSSSPINSSGTGVADSDPTRAGYRVNLYNPTGSGLVAAAAQGATADFRRRSQVSAGCHTALYVGSGTNYNALPWNGGVPIRANTFVERNFGRVFGLSVNDAGDIYAAGGAFQVDGTSGSVTINTSSFNISGLNAIGPFSRNGGASTVGVQIQEASNNISLLSSTGAADGNTVPTQFAVVGYVAAQLAPYLTNATAATTYQPLSTNLTGLAANNAAHYLSRGNHTGTQAASTITGLAAVATSGAYGDLTGRPTLGTAAATEASAYATAAQGAKADTAVQPAGLSPFLTSAVAVTTFQPLNTNLSSIASLTTTSAGLSLLTVSAAPTGALIGTTDTQTLTNKTIGDLKEASFTITDAAGFEINPANGPLQTITLGANRTPAATNFVSGQSVKLRINDGTAFSITWTNVGVVWMGQAAGSSGTAPTLGITGWTHIELWKEGSIIYGSLIGYSAT